MSTQDDDLQHIQATIAFGLDTKQFMGSTLGRYIQAKANEQIEAARDALQTVDPEDAKEVRRLQNDATVAAMVLTWIGQAVIEGEMAERQFESTDN